MQRPGSRQRPRLPSCELGGVVLTGCVVGALGKPNNPPCAACVAHTNEPDPPHMCVSSGLHMLLSVCVCVLSMINNKYAQAERRAGSGGARG